MRFFISLFLSLFVFHALLSAQTNSAIPIVVEAEDGALGEYFIVQNTGDISAITTTTDFAGQSGPESVERVATYNVSFPDSGSYQLFVRMWVGNGAYSDDSFFAASGFGAKDENTASDWLMINGLTAAGQTNHTEYVYDMGAAGSEMWKWINITQVFFGGEAFQIEEDNLNQIFQIASREDGLQFDKLAFGRSDLFYTVAMLDSVLAGSAEMLVDSSKFYQGPPLAQGSPKFLGNLKGGNDNNFGNLWNQLTPENEGKWASVGTSIDTTRWNWSGLDALYNYTRENNIPFKNHTLIWGAQQPAWINDLGPEKQLEYIEAWIRMTAQRYPETEMIDVVNEALPTHNPPDGKNDRANYKEALGGNGETGWDWVIKSFELARKYMPNTKLILNDYGIINDNGATNSYLKIINLLNERGLIDGIGVQGHRFELEYPPVSTLKNNLDKLGATGLPIYISELDLGNRNDEGEPDDTQQLEYYQKIFPVLWEHPSVVGITLWGYIQNRMWQNTCHLTNADGTWRPALKWLKQYIEETPVEINLPEPVSISSFDLVLNQNYPNPFSYSTNIAFTLGKAQNVSLKVFDSSGKTVAILADDFYEAGYHAFMWNASDNQINATSGGMYVYKLIAGNKSITKKMLFIEK